jgi:hypothetical protein
MSKNKLANIYSFIIKKGTTCASLFFISLATAQAYNEDLRLTEYHYESEGHLKGQCFEIDRRTKGIEYKVPKSDFFCEKLFPEKTTYFKPNKTGQGGECYEVDAQTKGHRYSQRKPYDFCKPTKTSFQWIENRCFEMGQREDGHQYRQSVASERCLENVATKNLWVMNKNGLSGSCYRIDSATSGRNVREMISTNECKPQQTINVWLQDQQNPTRGRCYTLDAQKGPEGFVTTTTDSDCLEKKAKYSWVQKNKLEGDCFALHQTNHGEFIPKKVPSVKCRPEAFEYHFVRENEFQGYCLERDLETHGKVFQQRVNIQPCRPKEVKTAWLEVAGDLRSGKCLMLDKKTEGKNYVELRPKEECLVSTGQYRFELNPKRLEGVCFEMIPLGSQQQRKTVSIDLCRPKEVRLAWSGDELTLEGHCYEIDKLYGAQAYLKRVPALRCKPFYLEDVEYRFHRAPGSKGGRCFEVDKKTGGLKYAATASEEKCRKQLSLPDL